MWRCLGWDRKTGISLWAQAMLAAKIILSLFIQNYQIFKKETHPKDKASVPYRRANLIKVLSLFYFFNKKINICFTSSESTRQVPIEIGSKQEKTLSIHWLLGVAKKGPGRKIIFKLSSELVDATKGCGGAISKRNRLIEWQRQIEL